MLIQKYLSTCCLSAFAIAIGCGTLMPHPGAIAANPTVALERAAGEQNSSPPGSSRGEERRSPAPQVL